MGTSARRTLHLIRQKSIRLGRLSDIGQSFFESLANLANRKPRRRLIVRFVLQRLPVTSPLQLRYSCSQADFSRLVVERRLGQVSPVLEDPYVPRDPKVVIALAAPRVCHFRPRVSETPLPEQFVLVGIGSRPGDDSSRDSARSHSFQKLSGSFLCYQLKRLYVSFCSRVRLVECCVGIESL